MLSPEVSPSSRILLPGIWMSDLVWQIRQPLTFRSQTSMAALCRKLNKRWCREGTIFFPFWPPVIRFLPAYIYFHSIRVTVTGPGKWSGYADPIDSFNPIGPGPVPAYCRQAFWKRSIRRPDAIFYKDRSWSIFWYIWSIFASVITKRVWRLACLNYYFFGYWCSRTVMVLKWYAGIQFPLILNG